MGWSRPASAGRADPLDYSTIMWEPVTRAPVRFCWSRRLGLRVSLHSLSTPSQVACLTSDTHYRGLMISARYVRQILSPQRGRKMKGRGKPATRAQPLLSRKFMLEPMKWVTEQWLLNRTVLNTPPMNIFQLNAMLLQETAILILHRMRLMMFFLPFNISDNSFFI